MNKLKELKNLLEDRTPENEDRAPEVGEEISPDYSFRGINSVADYKKAIRWLETKKIKWSEFFETVKKMLGTEFGGPDELPGVGAENLATIEASCYYDANGDDGWWDFTVYLSYGAGEYFGKCEFEKEFDGATFLDSTVAKARLTLAVIRGVVEFLWFTDEGGAILYKACGFKGRTSDEVWDNDEVMKIEREFDKDDDDYEDDDYEETEHTGDEDE